MRLPDHPAAVRKTRHVKTRALAALPGLALLSFAALANAQTVTWDGSDSDNWSDPDNWDVGVPGAGDDIIVDADPGTLIESGAFFGANLTVGALDYSVLEIVGASLSLTGDATIGDESFAGLYIEDGGTFSATNFTAGATPYGFGDILVSGAGSRLEASTIVIGGAGGGGGYLEVLDGAHVEADTLIFGVSYNSFAQAEFSGAGTIVSAANLVQIGVDTMGVWGGGAIITVADGASFVAPAGIELAHSPNSLGILVIAGDDPGIIDTPTITMGDGYPQIVFAHTSDHYVFTPDIVGSGADGYLWFADSGETVLTGQSGSFAGTIYIYNGARLIVDGALGGNFNVQTFLGGSGAVGNLLVYDFGVVSPGNSIGTLTANGNVTFEQDSFLEIEVNASGAGDLLVVTGDATLNGGQVRVLLENGAYAPSTTYRILEANSVNGAFDSVSPKLRLPRCRSRLRRGFCRSDPDAQRRILRRHRADAKPA